MTVLPALELSEREQTLAWFTRPYALLDQCAARFGDRFVLRIAGWGTQVVVADPQAIGDAFRAPAETLLAGHANAFLEPLFGRHSLLLLDAEQHLSERRRLLPAFHGERLRAQGRMMQEICRAQMSSWPEDTPLALQDAMLELSLEVILRAVFGVTGSPRYRPIRHLLSSLLRIISTTVAAAAVGGVEGPAQRTMKELAIHLAEECAERRAAGGAERSDVLQMLVDARHEDGTLASDAELRDQLLTLLAAGHETTAATLVWAVVLLADNPAALARLREEVSELGPDADPQAVARLPYLQAVVNETLRLRPVVPAVSRRVARPVRIGGDDLPTGLYVAPCIYLAHRRAALYPEPERFMPERFLENDFGPNEFLPFGGGTRRCVGMAFALHEAKIVLAELVSSFDFVSANRAELRPVRKTVVVAPSEGARFQLKRRHDRTAQHPPVSESR